MAIQKGVGRQRYQASPIRLISQLPRFTVADREVELAAVMSNPNIAVIRGLRGIGAASQVLGVPRELGPVLSLLVLKQLPAKLRLNGYNTNKLY